MIASPPHTDGSIVYTRLYRPLQQHFPSCDRKLWPMTLTFEPDLATCQIFSWHTHTNTHTTVLRPFFWDHPGEPVPERNLWTLRCRGRLTEADTMTIRLGATPSGLTSAHLHHPPHFFTGWMSFLLPNQQCKITEANAKYLAHLVPIHCPDTQTHTHTHQTNCSTWPLKWSGKLTKYTWLHSQLTVSRRLLARLDLFNYAKAAFVHQTGRNGNCNC